MRTTTARSACLLLAVLWSGAVPAAAADDLAGVWSAQVRTRGGLGAQMTFTAAGQVTSTFGALVDFKYEIEDNRIKMTSANPAEPTPSGPMVQEFTIEGDQMTLTRTGAQSQVMTRVGAPHRDAHPIVGDWSFIHYTGQPAVERYARNGVIQLTVPFQTAKGPYRLDNGALQIEFEGKPPLSLKIERDGNVLTTTDPNGKQIRFVKFEY
jgi:hypothetical protein